MVLFVLGCHWLHRLCQPNKRYIGCYGWNGCKQLQIFLVVFVSRRSFVDICNSIWLPAGVVRTKLNGGLAVVMVATVVSNYKSQLSQKLPAIIWTATHQRFSHNKFLGADIFKSKSVFIWKSTLPFAIIIILQPVKDLSELNSSNFHKEWRGPKSVRFTFF